MALTGTSLGKKEAGSDLLALFFPKFGGEVLRMWPQAFLLNGKYDDGPLSEAKEIVDRWAGRVNSADYTRHTNLIADTGGAQAPAGAATKFTEYVTQLDAPREVHDDIAKFDLLMSPAGDQDRIAIAKSMTEAIGIANDLRGLSAILQGASMPQPAIDPTTHPYNTKTIAGDSDHANFSSTGGVSDSIAGLDINASLTTQAAGIAIEDELFKLAEYFDNLGVPVEECYAAMSPGYVARIFREQGQRVSFDHAGANTSTHPTMGMMNGLSGPGFGTDVKKHATGFNVLRCRHLINLGTKLDQAFSPTATTGGKYTPGSAITSSLFSIGTRATFAPANGKAFEQNQGVNGPVDWANDAKKVRTAFNKVRIIAWHPRALRRGVLEGFQIGAEEKLELLRGTLIVAWLTTGWGVKDPTACVYAAEAVP